MYSKRFTKYFIIHFIITVVIAFWALGVTVSSQVSTKVDFRRDVQPLLKQYCIECHGPSQQMHGFRLDRRRDAMRGGTAVMITRGNSAGSKLYQKLIGSQYGPQMPLTGPLTAQQIETIKTWLDQGAEWPDDLSGDTPPPAPDAKAVRLMEALRDGDEQTFRKLVSADTKSINLKGQGGATPLMQAVLYGDSRSVQFLLDSGADPNIRNEAGATALMWAVDDLEKTRLLLDHGADVNAGSYDGRTPLLIAAGRRGCNAVVKLLLDRGANLAVKSPALVGYATPLAEAARFGDDSLLHMMIDRGADLKNAGLTSLANANRANCDKCLDTLTEHADRKALTMSAVLLSPPFGDGHAVKMLVDKGAEPNARDPEGRTLLMLAATSDAIPIDSIKTLIERGADVNAKDPTGRTALDFANLRGATSIVDLLVKAGCKDGTPFANSVTNSVPNPKPAASARAAFERSIPLLQKTDSIFMQKAGCVSCHHNTFTAITVSIARKGGLPVDEQIARNQVKAIASYIETWRERALQGVGIPGESATMSSILVGLAAENYPPDAATDAFARFLESQQWPDGRWRVFAHRPPIESSDFPVTANALRALQAYAPKTQRAKCDAAIKRGAEWLMSAQPQTTHERAYQLLGLGWVGVKPNNEIIRKRVREFLAEQRADGGWAQLPALASDAYATGEALVALNQAGALSTTDPAYKRGVAFLMRTQLEDGSWYVKTRAIPLQPFFESGFPHGHDQWISAAASNWAATALALSVSR
jgi:ankyrin repeat protein